MMDEQGTCKKCGNPFSKLRKNQEYCSSACREAYKYGERKADIEDLIISVKELTEVLREALKERIENKEVREEALSE